MIDPISFRPGAVSDRRPATIDKIDAAPAAAKLPDPRTEAAVVKTDARTIAAEMAAVPPVDQDRVLQIKRAIEQGRFPIVPAKIADRLIAARLEWAAPEKPE